ncbi:WD REPEATS REGION domain-containing protein [Citrus sinensis]|uniref:WD REPEATS REGION domain-containing protein n=1 Tax=Citrus sinensis TaxID=2711 RepID=A0ACB8LT27_CITSI|nr:WD REPEATS REGION domain-containing protein [Citrus sinensis]
MPRTTTLECPGCPPLRALTFDSLGLIKVIEARGEDGGVPKVVERWGDPHSSKCVLAASIDDSQNDPLLAVARKNGLTDILNPLNGDLRVAISNAGDSGAQPEDDGIFGLHLFKRQREESSSRSRTLLTCTTKGKASMRSIEVTKVSAESSCSTVKSWNVCASGTIAFSKVDISEKFSLFGGKGVEVNVWDLDKCEKIWTAKPPPKNSLGIFTPTWFTSAAFLSIDDHRKFVAGTNDHQVRLYDTSAQRRPVMSFDFRETPIKAVAEEPDSFNIYIGNGSGDLASVDIRTDHPVQQGKPGLVQALRSHHRYSANCTTPQVFLKQHLNEVVFDSAFADKEVANAAADAALLEIQNGNDTQEDATETLPVKRKEAPEEKDRSKKKKSKENEESKKLKSKKKRRAKDDIHDDAS